MKITFRPKALRDLEWFQSYYTKVFPQGGRGARALIAALYKTLLHHPHIGHPHEDSKDLRIIHVSKTPFSLIYRTTSQEIIILRVLDRRGQQPTKKELN
jgi:plasmid stabilization system protein ParE